MMSKLKSPKWYVVWSGHNPGVYSAWKDAEAQVRGVPGARFRSYTSKEEATRAYEIGYVAATAEVPIVEKKPRTALLTVPGPLLPSISVDAACDMTTGVMEYRGVDTETRAEIFRKGPFLGASNNIGEFLAIIHALSMLHRAGDELPVYTDSRTALSWLRHRHTKTTVQRTAENAEVFDLLDRAERWIQSHTPRSPVLKWETEYWGENPADFGRK